MLKKITKIQAQKRAGRFTVFLDGKYAFPVSEDVLVKYQLVKGMELDEEAIAELKHADEVAKAYSRTLDYLSYQLRTEKEIQTYLKKFELSSTDKQEIISKLKEMHLLDDLNYGQSFVRTQANLSDKGPKVIRQKLIAKGISPQLADQALDEYKSDSQIENGLALAAKLARRYAKDSFRIKKQKIRQGLLRKGFSGDILNEILDQLDLEPDQDQEAANLRRTAARLTRRYSRLPENQQKFKLKQALYRKGFSGDTINSYFDNLDE